ncbi:MAG: heavy-metal-associated domain-containing protein [Pyrinomonadaceae bacterium]|nr:heavy-metal-associated domain-containing protein [Pyrinomonadaceae bacterium]
MTTTMLHAPSIVCGGCASAIKKALGDVRGISQVDVDTTNKKVQIEHDERVPRAEIISILDRAGFPAS